MLPTDLPNVNLLLSKAFTHTEIQRGNRDKRVPPCRPEFLEYYFAASNGDALVLDDKSRLIGFSFVRRWGSISWIGPLSVLPSHQDKGFGTELVKGAIACLQSKGVRRIGLEMAADSCRNLAFYAKLGFSIECMTLDLVRAVGSDPPEPVDSLQVSRLSASPSVPGLYEDLSTFYNQFEEGLDYRPELEICLDRNFGDGLAFSDNGRILAFVLAHTATYSTEEQRQFLKVNILQILREQPITTLDTILYHLDQWAREEKLKMLYLRAPVLRNDTIRCFLARGFKIVQNDLRLVLQGAEARDSRGWLNLSKWE